MTTIIATISATVIYPVADATVALFDLSARDPLTGGAVILSVCCALIGALLCSR
jgi:hypothetical protein